MRKEETILLEMRWLFKRRRESIRKMVKEVAGEDGLALLDMVVDEIQPEHIEGFGGSEAAAKTALELVKAFQSELFALRIIDGPNNHRLLQMDISKLHADMEKGAQE